MGVAQFLSKVGKCLNGSLLTLDNIPPYFLPFATKPEVYDDEWEAEFENATSPGSRYNYPIFKGCTPRTISFTLRFDAQWSGLGLRQDNNNVISGGETITHTSQLDDYQASKTTTTPTTKGKQTVNAGRGFKDNLLQASEMLSIIAVLEKLKLPKQGWSTVVADIMGAFLRVQQGVSDPAPPLCLLALNPLKIMVGYFGGVKIKPEKYNRWMFPTRFSAECKFLVSPDYIFTNLEDVIREVYALASWGYLIR
jgi:hypothetical protein